MWWGQGDPSSPSNHVRPFLSEPQPFYTVWIMLTSMPFQLLSGKGWPTVLCSQQQWHMGQLETRPCHSSVSLRAAPARQCQCFLQCAEPLWTLSLWLTNWMKDRPLCRMRRAVAVLMPTYPLIFERDFQFLLVSSMILFPHPQWICKGCYQGHGLEGSIHSVCLPLVQAVLPNWS